MLNSLITKYYNFFSRRISFVSNGESQNKIICQSTLDTLELKKRFLVRNQREHIILNLSYYILFSYIV